MPIAPRAISQGAMCAGFSGEDAEAEAQDGVQAELAGKHHDGGRGSFLDGVGKPAVQGEDGHFDSKGDEEGQRAEQERRGAAGDCTAGGQALKRRHIERAGVDVEPENADQEDGRGNEGVEEELDCLPGGGFRCGRRWRSAAPWERARAPRSRSRETDRAKRRCPAWRPAGAGRGCRRACGARRWRSNWRARRWGRGSR